MKRPMECLESRLFSCLQLATRGQIIRFICPCSVSPCYLLRRNIVHVVEPGPAEVKSNFAWRYMGTYYLIRYVIHMPGYSNCRVKTSPLGELRCLRSIIPIFSCTRIPFLY